MGVAVASTLLAIVFGFAALILLVSTGWPGVLLLLVSFAMAAVASWQIKKNKPASER
jgi:hypothetical protein